MFDMDEKFYYTREILGVRISLFFLSFLLYLFLPFPLLSTSKSAGNLFPTPGAGDLPPHSPTSG